MLILGGPSGVEPVTSWTESRATDRCATVNPLFLNLYQINGDIVFICYSFAFDVKGKVDYGWGGGRERYEDS